MSFRLNENSTGYDLYRALQDHKTDDLSAVKSVIERRETRGTPYGRTFRLVELCAGRGRLARCYPSDWSVTAVDLDAVALEEFLCRRPDAQILQANLGNPITLPQADVVVCAHNSANEVAQLDALMSTAHRALAPGGLLYLDLVLTSDTRYPAYQRTGIRHLSDETGATWQLDILVIPEPDSPRHAMLLLGQLVDDLGRVRQRLLHIVDREVYSIDRIIHAGESRGLIHLENDSGRFIFEKSET